MAKVKRTLYLRGWADNVDEACVDASYQAAEHILGVANDLVPLLEGPLQHSGKVTVSEKGRQAGISYDTPYAVIQHENLDFQHAPGRIAKWLEVAMAQEVDTARQIMAAVLRRAGQRGTR